mgnify:CR=1 FL=1
MSQSVRGHYYEAVGTHLIICTHGHYLWNGWVESTFIAGLSFSSGNRYLLHGSDYLLMGKAQYSQILIKNSKESALYVKLQPKLMI